MSDKFNKAFRGVSEEELAKQDEEMINNFKSMFGQKARPEVGNLNDNDVSKYGNGNRVPAMPQGEVGNLNDNDISRFNKQSPKQFTNSTGQLTGVLGNVDVANRAQQLKELQDAEDAGAFEDAGSETNQRAARLRKLITGK